MKKPPLPRAIEGYDKEFYDLLVNWLLVCNTKERKTCAQTLANPYLAEGGWARYGEVEQEKKTPDEGEVEVVPRIRVQDDSTGQPVDKGTVWKLNTDGNPNDHNHWIKRDMWLAQNRSLCYYSVKENKRLVLIDGEKLRDATIEIKEGLAKEFAVEIKSQSTAEDRQFPRTVLGFDSQEELNDWMDKTMRVGKLDAMMTFFLGAKMAEDIQAFKLAVHNRRLKVESGKDGFEIAFKEKLWKLRAQGDRTKEEDWFLREMWITTNGSLVYYSPKEERDLVYYTAADLGHAQVVKAEDQHSLHQFGLTILLQATGAGGVEFEPGEFAAETEEARQRWIDELSNVIGGSPDATGAAAAPEAAAPQSAAEAGARVQ